MIIFILSNFAAPLVPLMMAIEVANTTWHFIMCYGYNREAEQYY